MDPPFLKIFKKGWASRELLEFPRLVLTLILLSLSNDDFAPLVVHFSIIMSKFLI